MWVTRSEGGPRKVNHAAVTIDGKIYSFGGYCSGEESETNLPMEICVLDPSSLRWKALYPNQGFDEDLAKSQVPFQRYGHTAVVWGHSALIWGGRDDKTGCCNALHMYCYNTIREVWMRLELTGSMPLERDGHAAAILGSDMHIFGGFDECGNRFSSDLYRLHLPTLTWTHLMPTGPCPTPRDFATMEAVGNELLVWGGRGDLDADGQFTGTDKYENVLYIYNIQFKLWEPRVLDNSPAERRSHASFVYKDKMYVFGGFNGRDHFNDLWVFDRQRMCWTEINFLTSDIIPNPRRRMCCCVHGDRMYMFGGTSPTVLAGPPANPTENDGLLEQGDLFVYEFTRDS